MIIVSNTSPLTNLAAIGQFDLLRGVYVRSHIADGVWEELNADGGVIVFGVGMPADTLAPDVGISARHLAGNAMLSEYIAADDERCYNVPEQESRLLGPDAPGLRRALLRFPVQPTKAGVHVFYQERPFCK